MVTKAVATARGRPLVFVFRGEAPGAGRHARLFEVSDPYLEEGRAQAAFVQADRAARRSVADRRYVYVPGWFGRGTLGDIWRGASHWHECDRSGWTACRCSISSATPAERAAPD